jgi:hypothetical protein
MVSQNGMAPMTKKKEGAKMASKQIDPPIQPFGARALEAPK